MSKAIDTIERILKENEALTAERDREKNIGAAWKMLAMARRDMLRTPDATATPSVRDRIHTAVDTLRDLGIDPSA